VTGRLILRRGPLHDPKSVATLKKLNLDVGLHKAGVIYRDVTVGATVFFIDTGIDTGARILLAEEVDISNCRSVTEAKQYLFSLDKVFFPRALALLSECDKAFHLNDGSGPRYLIMSKLFTGVVEQLLQGKTVTVE